MVRRDLRKGDYVYALVRYYKNPRKKEFKSDERIIEVGTREEDIVVKNFYLFRDRNGSRIVRLEFEEYDNGGYRCSIIDEWEKRKVLTFVPLDDIVEDCFIWRGNR